MPSLIDELHELAKSLGWEHGTETGRIAYEAAARIAALEAQLAEAREALDALDRMNRGLDWCDQDEQARRWSAARRVLEACGTTEAIEAVAASLSGTPSPIPGDTQK